jgi:hypothetical protein
MEALPASFLLAATLPSSQSNRFVLNRLRDGSHRKGIHVDATVEFPPPIISLHIP